MKNFINSISSLPSMPLLLVVVVFSANINEVDGQQPCVTGGAQNIGGRFFL
jgi:hypothetical protein